MAQNSERQDKCPVDHLNKTDKCPVEHKTQADSCPVDHSSRQTWTNLFGSSSNANASSSSLHSSQPSNSSSLPTDREVSSIPRTEAGEKWVYPSQAQFFAAMARKQHNPQEKDMPVIVPIHNAVNERAWGEVMKWEQGMGGEKCGGVKLVSFKGRPKDRTLRAWGRVLLGYQAPFDRHDWVVDRCGTRTRYIIDFYTGRNVPNSLGSGRVSFYLDVRPALDSWEGVKMRTAAWWDRWLGGALAGKTPANSPSPTSTSSPTSSPSPQT